MENLNGKQKADAAENPDGKSDGKENPDGKQNPDGNPDGNPVKLAKLIYPPTSPITNRKFLHS